MYTSIKKVHKMHTFASHSLQTLQCLYSNSKQVQLLNSTVKNAIDIHVTPAWDTDVKFGITTFDILSPQFIILIVNGPIQMSVLSKNTHPIPLPRFQRRINLSPFGITHLCQASDSQYWTNHYSSTQIVHVTDL